jgi:hypothetical protein
MLLFQRSAQPTTPSRGLGDVSLSAFFHGGAVRRTPKADSRDHRVEADSF